MSPAVAAVLFAGVCAALQSSKLAPAIPLLRAELGLSLVQAGFALSMVQGAGMMADEGKVCHLVRTQPVAEAQQDVEPRHPIEAGAK